MWKCALFGVLMIAVCCGPVRGQGKAGLLKEKLGNNDSDANRKDVEGVIWEYKVMQHDEKDRSDRTKMTGRLRIKQTSLFAVGKVEYSNSVEKEEKDDGKADEGNEAPIAPAGSLKERLQGKKPTTSGEGGEDIKKQAKEVLSQKLKQHSEEQTGSERIGDLIKQLAKEYTFRFDEDDDYPLSGLAVVQPDTKSKGGVWLGYYDEFEDGKKKKRWRIEMRKIEE
jgi:hypothetical protein